MLSDQQLQTTLRAILIDIPPFPFKARQKFLTEERFNDIKSRLLPEIIDYVILRKQITFDDFDTEETSPSYHYECGPLLYKWMMLHYTAGAPTLTIMEMMKTYYYTAKSIFDHHQYDLDTIKFGEQLEALKKKFYVDHDCFLTHLIYLPYESVIAITPLAIAGLTEGKEMILKSVYLHSLKKDFDHYVVESFIEPDVIAENLMYFFMEKRNEAYSPKVQALPFSDSDLRVDLLKAIHAPSVKETQQHLDNYLQKWCQITAKSSWNDEFTGHLEDSFDFFGYWAFDAAVIAYLKNVDDSLFHKYFFYQKVRKTLPFRAEM